MKRILVITTINCIACKVQINNLNKAIEDTNSSNIKLEIRDFSEISPRFLTNLNIDDFPATIFYGKHNSFEYVIKGSKTVVDIINTMKEIHWL